VRSTSPDTLTTAWHPHCCPVCNQTWGHSVRRCAEPEESLCNSCLIYPVLASTNPSINEPRIRIELLSRACRINAAQIQGASQL
jgi:hypothetical protein